MKVSKSNFKIKGPPTLKTKVISCKKIFKDEAAKKIKKKIFSQL